MSLLLPLEIDYIRIASKTKGRHLSAFCCFGKKHRNNQLLFFLRKTNVINIYHRKMGHNFVLVAYVFLFVINSLHYNKTVLKF